MFGYFFNDIHVYRNNYLCTSYGCYVYYLMRISERGVWYCFVLIQLNE